MTACSSTLRVRQLTKKRADAFDDIHLNSKHINEFDLRSSAVLSCKSKPAVLQEVGILIYSP